MSIGLTAVEEMVVMENIDIFRKVCFDTRTSLLVLYIFSVCAG